MLDLEVLFLLNRLFIKFLFFWVVFFDFFLFFVGVFGMLIGVLYLEFGLFDVLFCVW